MTTTYRDLTMLTTMTCGECGIVFAMPEAFRKEREELGHGWYCPNGHSRAYRESDVDRLTRQRDWARAQARHHADQREATERSLSATERSLRATKGALTKVKKRIGNGVCPHCNRHFTNVERHMKTEHPEAVNHA